MAASTAKPDKSKQIGAKREKVKKLTPWMLAICIFIVIVRIVSPSFYFTKIDLHPGNISDRHVIAQFDMDVIDKDKTEKKKETVENIYTRYFVYDSEVLKKVYDRSAEIIAIADSLSAENEMPVNQKIIQLIKNLRLKSGVDLKEEEANLLLAYVPNNQFKNILNQAIKHLLVDRVIISEPDLYKTCEKMGVAQIKNAAFAPPMKITPALTIGPLQINLIIEKFLAETLKRDNSQIMVSLVSKICTTIIEPNLLFDQKASSEDRTTKIADIEKEPAIAHFDRGDKIISVGDKITNLQYDAIQIINNKIFYTKVRLLVGTMALVIASFVLVAFFIKKFKPEFDFNLSSIIIISLPLLGCLLFERILFHYFNFKETQLDMAAFMFPVGAIGMLGVVFLEARVAFLLVIWSSILMGIMIDEFTSSFWFVIYYWISGFSAVGFLYTIKEGKDILSAGLKTAFVNAMAILAINLLKSPTDIHAYQAIAGLINGLLCTMLVFPGIRVFENMFGIVTDIKLLELTGINQKILQEFEEKAPGSYQHSLNVAKLADSAAVTIGARYLFARAGAYYHDLGKMTKPQYFSENQVTPDDKKVHAKLSPHMSTLIIKNHIREGIELAKKHGIPQSIIDFIPQHHGTALIKFFYATALKNFENSDSADPVREEDFRYPGPKPQTIEAAIVMLADSVEATVTAKLAKAHITEDDIRLVVRDTIRDKFNDGQFDECNLTLRDLHRISESFVNTLRSRFHHRIDYPTLPQKKEQ